jgi:hypothetical protein
MSNIDVDRRGTEESWGPRFLPPSVFVVAMMEREAKCCL